MNTVNTARAFSSRSRPAPRRGLAAAALLLLAACSGEPRAGDENLSSAADSADSARVAELRAQLAGLRQQAGRLKDINALKRLQRTFGYYMSEGMWDEVADLFAEDASWEFARDGVYEGRERIRSYLYAMHGGEAGLHEGQLNEYLQLMPVLTLDEDGRHAKGRWRAIMLLGELGGTALWGEGPYENEYVKQDGVWKFSKLRWYQSVLVSYEGGWGRNEDYNQGLWVSESLPPDAPPTSDDGWWPTTYLPPFSFENPVGRYMPPADGQAEGQGGQQ